MRTKRKFCVLFLSVFTLLIAPGLRAQGLSVSLSRISPWDISIRAVAASSNYDVIFVGDEGYCATLLNSTGNWGNYFLLNGKISFLSAAYADTLHAAAAGTDGTVYYTTNDGTGWRAGTSGTTASLRGMATDRHGNLFVVGDSGIILKSTNYGKNWARLQSPVTKQLNAIAFGSDGKYAVAVGNDSAIVVTTDGGSTWNTEPFPYDLSSLGSAVSSVDFSAVVMSPGEDSVWVGLERPVLPLLLVKGKADPAQSFDFLPNSGPLTALTYDDDTDSYIMAFAPDDNLYYYSYNHWFTYGAAIIGGNADGTRDTALDRNRCAIVLAESGGWQLIYAGDELFATLGTYVDSTQIETDLIMDPPGASFSADYLDADVRGGTGWIIGSEGIIDYMVAGSFSRYIQKQASATVNTVWYGSASTAIVIGWDGLILRTEDSGFAWQTIPSGTQLRLHGIDFPTANTGIITGDFGYIIRSTDAGFTWNPVSSPTTEYLLSVAFTDSVNGVATGDSATILRTTDAGASWSVVNNILTGTDTAIRKVQAFPGGIFLAQAGASLIRSTDYGQNWAVVSSPGDSIGMSFYNSQIGIIGTSVASSAIVPDTVTISYTNNGGNNWYGLTLPFYNERRLIIYWLNANQVVLNGVDGFVDELTFTGSGVTVTPLSTTPSFQVYPNPSSGEVNVDYTTKTDGPVTIELWDETGKKVETLFNREETGGDHTHLFSISKELHGSFFIRAFKDGEYSMAALNLH